MGIELENHQYKREIEEMDVNYSDSDLVYHVRDALLSVQKGDCDSYNQLVGVMHHSERLTPDDVALLLTSLKALTGAVSYIDDIHHDRLLESIFGMSLWNYVPDVMDALIELIIALAASNGKYVGSCLKMLVSNFMPPMYLVDILKLPRCQAKKGQVLSRVHTALEAIAHLVPMSASILSTIVVERLPPTASKKLLENNRLKYRTEIYVENMLRLESGAIREFVGNRMLMAVVDMLIDLDVTIGWDDILGDDSYKGIFALELEDIDEDADDDDEDNDYDELPRMLSLKSLGKNVVADLLDSLMVRTFEHLELCARNKRLSEVFETLLDSFMLTILNTYKSKFAQFVMFYACALDPENCGVKFAERLRDRFFFGDNPLTRMSAVAYLASYLARAKFLPVAFVASTLKRLVDWCLEYCNSQDGDMNPKAHRVFYSGCQVCECVAYSLARAACSMSGLQRWTLSPPEFLVKEAILYVLCFRMRSMMDVLWLKSQLLHMPLEQIMKHKLRPLKVCLPSIVEEFLKQAKAAHLFTTSHTFSFEDFLESDFSEEFGGLERLDMFFPFDPCLLKTCDRSFIRRNFVYWKDVRATYGSDEEDISDEDIAEDFVSKIGGSFMEEEEMASSSDEQHLDLDEFDSAMNKMSITPKNGFSFRFGESTQMPSKIRPSTSPESL